MVLARTLRFLLCALLLTAPAALAQTDLAINKTGPATAARGGTVDYTIDVTNLSSTTASGTVTVTDPVTGGWSFISVTPPAGFSCSTPNPGDTSGTVTCTAASLPASTTRSFLISFEIPGNAVVGTVFTNTATVSTANDPNGNNNSSSAQTAVAPSADLTVQKSGPATAAAGTDVPFDIAVTNLGPDDSGPLSLTDLVTGGWSFVSVTPPAGFSCSDPGAGATSGMVSCSGSNLAAGATVHFTIVFHLPAQAAPGTSFTNVATVSAASDPNPENNSGGATTSTPPLPSADTGILKEGPTGAAPDSNVAYTITATNSGPNAAQNVSWTDTLPAGILGPDPQPAMTFVSLTQNSGPAFSCTPGQTTTCTLASMPAGSTATFTLVAHVPSGVPTGTTYTNTATVTSNADPNVENDSSSSSLTVSSADVSVNKTAPATAVAGGASFNYVITLANSGPDTAVDASFNDALPAGVVFVSIAQNNGPAASCSTPPVGTNGSVGCLISFLGSGASAQFTVTVRALQNVPNGTVVSNTATATTASADTNQTNNSSTASTTIAAQADLSIVKSAPATATAGNNVTYTITVANAGPSDAVNVSWNDVLPPNTTFVSFNQTSGPAFSCTTGATVACSIATFPSGAGAVFSLTVRVAPSTANGTVIANTATVASPTESNGGNNSSTATTAVQTLADLSIVKTGPAAVAGNDLTYTINVANAGPSDALNVSWNDVLPPNTTFVSLNQTSGPVFSCTTGATVTCNIAAFASGAGAAFSLTVHVAPSTANGTAINNTAAIASPTADPNGTNNSSTASTAVQALADLSVSKSGPATTPSNTTVTYTVSVANAGPSDAISATLTETVPANMTFVSATQTSGPLFTCSGTGPVTCTIASFGAGAGATFQFVFNVPAGVPFGTATTNTATIGSPTTDPNGANNTASVNTTVMATIPALSPLALMMLAAAVATLALFALRR